MLQFYNNKNDVELTGLQELFGISRGINGNAINCDIWINAAGLNDPPKMVYRST